MMPSSLGFGNLGSNQGSPTRMEMGQGGMSMNTVAEVPVPDTPPGADEVRGFGLQSNGNANVRSSNLAGNVGGSGVAGNLTGVGGSGGVGSLSGSFGSAANLSGVPVLVAVRVLV